MRRWLGLAAFVLLVAAVTAGAALWWVKTSLERPFQGYPGEERIVLIEEGTTASRILERLEAEGVLENQTLARQYLIRVLEDPPLQAGEYRFSGPLTIPQVLDQLIRGDVLTYSVTLVEGLTLEEQAEHLAQKEFGSEALFLEAMRSPEMIADLDPYATDLEGYLFPDTYSFPRGVSEKAIVRALVENFRQQLQKLPQPLPGITQAPSTRKPVTRNPATQDSDDNPRAVRDLVTLASIVEKEARLDDERPVIAAVYTNRLERGIALYADPTVIFGLKRMGRWNGNLRRPDLQVDSPYNTYRYPGLPPGPIASPGLRSLQAAAAPADVPYLYFVSRNDGSHVFAKTLAEHNRNVNEWQKRYWRRKWAQQAK